MKNITSKVDSFCQKIINYSFIILFAFVPLFFAPFNYELFEFNKMLLTYSLTAIIATAWLTQMTLKKKIIFKKTPLFWPLIAFLISQTIATFTSIVPRTSLLGYYTRQNGGLLSIFAYIFLYFAFVSNIKKKTIKKLLFSWLVSIFLINLYGIAQRLGIDDQYWQQDVIARIFSTLGQPNWLAAWLNVLIFIPLALFIHNNNKSKNRRKNSLVYFLIFFTSFVCLLLTRSRSGFLSFIPAYIIFWFLFLIKSKKIRQKFPKKDFLLTIFSLIVATVFLLSPFPQINQYFDQISLIKPSALPHFNSSDQLSQDSLTEDIRKVVWQGAWQLGKQYPFWGTGVETFAYSYYWVKPVAHNLLSEWDFLYNKAHNEYLNYLANTGFIGLISYLAIIIFFLFQAVSIIKSRSIKDPFWQIITMALCCGYLTILVTNFFGFSIVTINTLFFLIPALVFVITSSDKKSLKISPSPLLDLPQIITLLAIFTFLIISHYYIIRRWRADYFFSQGEKQHQQNQYSHAHQAYQKALQLNPHEPFYTNSAATNLAYLALLLNDKYPEKSKSFLEKSKELARYTLEKNPYHLNFYRQQTQTYFVLGKIDIKYLQESQKLLLKAHQLAPTDAKITYNLGVLAYQRHHLLQAITWLEKTIILKPNYEKAHSWLAEFYQENNQNQKAQEIHNY